MKRTMALSRILAMVLRILLTGIAQWNSYQSQVAWELVGADQPGG